MQVAGEVREAYFFKTDGAVCLDGRSEIAAILRKYDLWFHVDGAYGAPASVLPDASAELLGLREADSIALDPHKWLYSPLEVGCALVRDPNHLLETFSHHPAYYNFEGTQEDPPINYHEYGLQNSRGFRALKVWLGLRHVGRDGYVQMIGDDIALAQALYKAVGTHPELEAATQHLSITTFRFVPLDLPKDPAAVEPYLNNLNEELLNRLQRSGEAFISNAVIDGKYLLRACIVNFHTTLSDVEALPEIVIRLAVPTPYRVIGSRTSWWANCAWDMLGVAVLANEPVRIEASCADCGEPMILHADPRAGSSDAAVVHFLVSARRWYDDIGFT